MIKIKIYYKFKVWKLKRDIEYYLKLTGKYSDHKQNELSEYLHKLNIQHTFVYCPDCHNELVGSGSFVNDEVVVTYKCSHCGLISHWNFDMFPPTLVHSEFDVYFDKIDWD